MSARSYRSVGITDEIDGYLFRTARRRTVHWTNVFPSLGGAPDIGLAFNALAPPTDGWRAAMCRPPTKFTSFAFRAREQLLSVGRLHRSETLGVFTDVRGAAISSR